MADVEPFMKELVLFNLVDEGTVLCYLRLMYGTFRGRGVQRTVPSGLSYLSNRSRFNETV